jgi:hypothetical protein
MHMEPISPELALIDPDLDARARAVLPDPAPAQLFPRAAQTVSPAEGASRSHRAYPFWARVTAAMWLVVLGILIGGAAIPHAQDTPRVVPQDEDARFCKAPPAEQTPVAPTPPELRP